MIPPIGRPDPEVVLRGLKDFQRTTVDYVFRRLYLDADFTRRFLIADEVGLGKTLVARGLIARTIERLWDQVERIDIVYICSNADIARQNINRLNISEDQEVQLASRITLLPITLRELRNNRINFVSFTPGTSFDLKQNLGISRERAMLYWLLQKPWGLSEKAALNVLRGGSSAQNFRSEVKSFPDEHEIDSALAEAFVKALTEHGEAERREGRKSLRERFAMLCDVFTDAGARGTPEQRAERNRLVGDLRGLLATTCLRALEPDLVIMDEFQRFKHLLQGDDEASQLARELFNYQDKASSARVLLLSATPYKMYTLHHESDEDHYADFMKTLEFLVEDPSKRKRLQDLIAEYRRGLLRISEGNTSSLLSAKRDLEAELRKVMVRTERLAVSADRNGMLREVASGSMTFSPSDASSYRALQKVARVLEHSDTIEYWKSSPYLLNFMDDYELKIGFEDALDVTDRHAELTGVLKEHHQLLLPWQDIKAYLELDPRNAKLRSLMTDTVGTGAWKLLWIPPALPYYRPGGPFADPAAASLTKRLLFSSWIVVPKVVSTLLSYEVERRMIRSVEENPDNSPEARKRRRPLLRFAMSEGRLSGMPLLSLIYPSTALARECDPLAFRAGRKEGEPAAQSEVLEWARNRIEKILGDAGFRTKDSGPEDETWYWAAPILLDWLKDRKATKEWFDQEDLATDWSRDMETAEDEQDDGGSSRWAEHVEMARSLILGKVTLGRPPADLSLVLAHMALAGPAVVALRSLTRVSGNAGTGVLVSMRLDAANVGWAFLSLFNLPEVVALLRGMNRQEPYWRRVLEYAFDGNLQAVIDEYAHVLREAIGMIDAKPEVVSEEIATVMFSAVSLRTASLRIDEIRVDGAGENIELEDRRMRVRFAARLTDEQVADDETTRSEQVREAFNSPFWPFVLATTSVGQEGLDFHPYCHAVVHWNLPSNPVDLEQREGRIHRYKGHAVRKNVARRHGLGVLRDPSKDPWDLLFAAAAQGRAPGVSDLVPYWIYPVEGGATIERHVPAHPLSRDIQRLIDLRRSLTVYRMVFGQARQEDLIQHLLRAAPASAPIDLLNDLKVDLSPQGQPEPHIIRPL